MQPLTIGRIVHYKDQDNEVWPAIVARISGQDIQLRIFNDQFTVLPVVTLPKETSMADSPSVAERGQWWWPNRV